MVVDTSALLALILGEPLEGWVFNNLAANLPHLRMSTVNYAEVLIVIADRRPEARNAVADFVETTLNRLVAPTARQAELAAYARLRCPLNLGDCFAYALAKEENCPLLTLDRDFRNCDIEVVLPS